MSYITQNLSNSEHVIDTSRVHWFVFIPGISIVAFTLYMASAEPIDGSGSSFWLAVSPLIILVGVIMLLSALIAKLTTEIGVTNKRIIAKHGLLFRKTVELNLSKVESINVDQSILGRIFGYGTLIVTGTGG